MALNKTNTKIAFKKLRGEPQYVLARCLQNCFSCELQTQGNDLQMYKVPRKAGPTADITNIQRFRSFFQQTGQFGLVYYQHCAKLHPRKAWLVRTPTRHSIKTKISTSFRFYPFTCSSQYNLVDFVQLCANSSKPTPQFDGKFDPVTYL